MKKILIGFPENLLVQVDATAEAECRTRSELIREAVRRYLEQFRRSQACLRLESVEPVPLALVENS